MTRFVSGNPIFAAILSLGITGGAGLVDITAAQAQQFKISPAMKAYIWQQTNAYRKSKGLPPLRILLLGAAQPYAAFLARNNATGHTADGRTPAQRLVAAGEYRNNCGVWENVADYWSSPNIAPSRTAADFAMDFWKRSQGHRENLERANAKVLIVGEAGWTHGGKHYYKFVQMFVDDCKPYDPHRPIKSLGKRPR
ncbi:CAP domain-containing protein [Xanthobacteraceae bacterium Astr-EGSB]|uniref:CAP domain-containing protein n=1 Tax=Astrobacterium formosum TaxID=3069710 RepID=UPI0027B238D7|nr:CAP domain-containing protein [Xanthobacteraceae bacterium Astr-EGSB]